MEYNFDKVINRKGTNSVKWEFMNDMFGTNDLLPLWVADMDFECPKPVIEAIQKRATHGIFGYSSNDYEEYYISIMNWMKKRYNWEIEKDWIVHTPGVVPALAICVQTFTNPGDQVIIQRPVYYPFTRVIVNNGRIISNNSLKYENNKYSIDYEDLERRAKDSTTKLMILCSPHNPVGRVWTKDELTKIGEICLRNNVILVSDEIHGDLVHSGNKHIPFTSISKDFEKNTIVCTALSKTFNLAGLNTSSIIIANEELRANFKKTSEDRNASPKPNPFGIVATQAAYNHGEEWLEQVIEYIEDNMSYIDEFLKDKLTKVKMIKSEGTYLAWLDFSDLGLSKDELWDIIVKKAKVGLDDGSIFGEEGIGFQRINVGCPRSILEECMNRIEKVLKE
ncbi:pyridoxal phosphate-dependent aminotransferase [Lutibacter sp. B2]|nr:pyridoxal phosphate-dependent aminotransferase [Lutibacter sp. B2]